MEITVPVDHEPEGFQFLTDRPLVHESYAE